MSCVDESITLVDDWDYQPKLGKEIGHHTTRKREHSVLVDFLTRRNEGALLVCGHRGVGKTSSVIAAINEASKDRDELIPILIKATSIYSKPESSEQPLLRYLIRSFCKELAHRSLPDGLKEKINMLYQNSTITQAYNEESSGSSRSAEATTKTRWSLIPLITLSLFGALLLLQPLPNELVAISMFVTAAGLFAYHERKTITSNIRKKSEYRRHDYAFVDLQSEFEELLNDLPKSIKILFVLDEFDKIPTPLLVVRNLKMLINQGNMLFIFITTQEILSSTQAKGKEEYTIFSQTLFLKKPLFKEMESFLDRIVDQFNDKIKNEPRYKNLKNYLCYVSHTDFFEIYGAIRDLAFTSKSGKPSLSLDLNRSRITKANLQKSIGWIYERKQLNDPMRQESNYRMLDELYDVASRLESMPNSQTVTLSDDAINFGNSHIKCGSQKITLASDLLLFLARQGYVRKENDSTYTKLGVLANFRSNLAGIFVEEQRTFITTCDVFKEKIADMANTANKLLDELDTPFSVETFEAKWHTIVRKTERYCNVSAYNKIKEIYEQLTKSDPPLIPSDELQTYTNAMKDVITSIHSGATLLLTDILAKKAQMTVQRATPLSQKITEKNLRCTTLQFNKENKTINQIAVVYPPLEDELDSTHNADNTQNNLIICLGNREQFDNSRSNKIAMVTSKKRLEQQVRNLSRASENKTIYFAMRLPLQPDVIVALIQILDKS